MPHAWLLRLPGPRLRGRDRRGRFLMDAPFLSALDDGAKSGTTRERAAAPGNAAEVKKTVVFAREPHEHYVEERRVSRELFARMFIAPVIVDPCAGFGNIVMSAREAGVRAYGSDLVKRGPLIAGGRDFLSEHWRPPVRVRGAFAIVCNPPFGHRDDLLRGFCEAACDRAEIAVLLAPTHRLRCAGRWLARLPLAALVYSSLRPSMWPGPIYARKIAAGEDLGTGRAEVAWLYFKRGHEGGPVLTWLGGEGG